MIQRKRYYIKRKNKKLRKITHGHLKIYFLSRELKGKDLLFVMECIKCMHDNRKLPKVPENLLREVRIIGGVKEWLQCQGCYQSIYNLIYDIH